MFPPLSPLFRTTVLGMFACVLVLFLAAALKWVWKYLTVP